jgi:hypothetical protein
MSQIGFFRPTLITLLGIGIFCLAPAQANTFYKWVDAEGVTHYGAKPPEEQDATKIKTSGQAASDAARGEAVSESLKKNAEKDAQAQQKKQKDAAKAKTDAELAEELKKNCEQAKNNAATLSTSARVREKDAEGNFRYLAPEEQQKRINETQEYLNTNCGNVESH